MLSRPWRRGRLYLGRSERLPAWGRALAAGAVPDAVGPEPAAGLVQDGPRIGFVAALGQYDSQILQSGRDLRPYPVRGDNRDDLLVHEPPEGDEVRALLLDWRLACM
jgi:hypothetical protein